LLFSLGAFPFCFSYPSAPTPLVIVIFFVVTGADGGRSDCDHAAFPAPSGQRAQSMCIAAAFCWARRSPFDPVNGSNRVLRCLGCRIVRKEEKERGLLRTKTISACRLGALLCGVGAGMRAPSSVQVGTQVATPALADGVTAIVSGGGSLIQ
jgi:hypothetical protein